MASGQVRTMNTTNDQPTMDSDRVIAAYEGLSTLTGRMLAAARNGDWDQLVVLELDRSARFERLARDGDVVPDNPAQRLRKATLIQRILDEDIEIRELVEPRRTDLSALIGSTRREARVQHAYRSSF